MEAVPSVFGYSILTVFLSFAAVGMSTFICLKNKRNHWKSRNSPPGPRGVPILGHLPLLGTKPHVKLTEWSQTFGQIFRIDFGSHPTVVINGMDAIRSVIKTTDPDLRRSISGRPPFPSLKKVNHGYSMTPSSLSDPGWSEKKRWLRQATSNFTTQNKLTIENTIIYRTESLVKNLQKEKIVNPSNEISAVCISSILDLISFSAREEQKLQESSEVQRIIQCFQQLSETFMTAIPDLFPILSTFFTGPIQRVQDTSTAIANLFSELLKTNVQSYDKSNMRDLADHFLQVSSADGQQNDDVMRRLGLFGEFMGATESTIGTILRWALLYAATHKEEQELIRKELQVVVGDGSVTLDHQKHLVRTRAFIAEIMRKCAILPFLIPHWTISDTKIGPYDIPKDTLILFNSWSALRDPNQWEEPNTFNPERFLDHSGEFRYDRLFSFLHFGGGERRCLGQRIGQWILFLTFANIINKCTLSQVPGEKYDFEGRLEFNIVPYDYKIHVEPADA